MSPRRPSPAQQRADAEARVQQERLIYRPPDDAELDRAALVTDEDVADAQRLWRRANHGRAVERLLEAVPEDGAGPDG